MVDYTTIRTVLQRIEVEYNNYMTSSDPYMPQLLSKLAVMEFCGWIEESIDNILYDYLDNHLIDNNGKRIIKGFVKKVYGFSFEENIYKIFAIVVGANNWENIYDSLSTIDKNNFKSIVNTYSSIRNGAAHSNTVIGVTLNYNTPSQVISDFSKIEPAIKSIEASVANLRQ